MTPGISLKRCSTPQKQPPANVAFSISPSKIVRTHHGSQKRRFVNGGVASAALVARRHDRRHAPPPAPRLPPSLHRPVRLVLRQIGRASCRERGGIWVVAM